jgi:hypothetical protein
MIMNEGGAVMIGLRRDDTLLNVRGRDNIAVL